MAGDVLSQRIEGALHRALARASGASAPPRLVGACRAAVFPAGQRIRPRLTLAVALASGDDRPLLANAAAAAVELLHCAALVHDDMPCFDDAPLRRGQPSVHAAHGEALALLAGDALIVLAFEAVALAAAADPLRACGLSLVIARGVGMPNGIVAGQGWESEADADLGAYQRAKTGALFAAAAQAGAVAAGAAAEPWGLLGDRLGEAYQVADDIRDVMCSERVLGKPAGQDEALGRPSAVRELGLQRATLRLRSLVEEAADGVPDCPGAGTLRSQIRLQASRFLPEEIARNAA